MSTALQAVSLGMQFFGAVGSHKAAKAKAQDDKRWQEYNNKMTRIKNAMNQNVLTTNQNMKNERVAMQRMQLQRSELGTAASVEVSAAATGTIGRSVNMTLFDVGRNAAQARAELTRDSEWQDNQIDHQRVMSNFETETQLDLRHIPKPSNTSLLLGLTDIAVKNKDSFKGLGSALRNKL